MSELYGGFAGKEEGSEIGAFFYYIPYRKLPIYRGLNAKVLEQHRSTPTSVVKP